MNTGGKRKNLRKDLSKPESEGFPGYNNSNHQIKYEDLDFLRLLSLELNRLEPGEDPSECFAGYLGQHTGAVFVSYAVYHSFEKRVETKKHYVSPQILKKIVAIAGKKIINGSMFIDEDTYRDILHNPYKVTDSLHDVSLGLVSEEAGKLISKIFRIDKYITVSHIIGDEFLGTTVLAIPKGMSIPSAPFLDSYASMVALSVKRQKAEESMKLNEKKYRYFSEEIEDVIWEMDASTLRINYVSPAVQKLLGYNQEEFMGIKLDKMLSPASYRFVMETLPYRIKAFLDGDTSFRVRTSELEQVHKEGRYIPTEVVSTLVRDTRGRIKTILGVTRNISERKLAEQAVAESNRRLNTLINNLNGVVYRCKYDENWTMEFISHGIEEMAGYPASDFLFNKVRTFNSIIHPDDREKLWKEWKYAVDDNKVFTEEYRIITAAGEVKWVWERGCPIYEKEEIIALEGYILDFTEKKKATDALSDSERKYREIFNSTSDALFIDDIEGNIIDVNDTMLKMYEYDRIEDILAGNVGDLSANIPPYDQEAASAYILKAIKGEPQRFEWLAKTKTGKHFWVEVYIKRIEIAGEPRLLVSARDIHEKVIAEKALNEKNEEYLALNEELEESLIKSQKMNEDLMLAKLKAEESDRLKTAFLHNMSHEIRTPMNGILGFSELLLDGNLPPEKRARYTNVIHASGEQLLHIIDDVLDASRLETGQVYLDNSLFSVNAVVDLVAMLAGNQIKLRKKNIDLRIRKGLEEGKDHIFSDKARLTQILTNLMTNAVKFTEEGHIELSYILKKTFLEFTVKDSGIGIDQKNQQKIWERFVQSDEQIQKTYGGSGLGLAIVKGLTELMRGTVKLESEPGKGSLFTITIPYQTNEDQYSTNFSLSGGINTQAPLILIAEDSDHSYQLIEEYLSGMKVSVIRAMNGREAVKAVLSDHKPVLVLMDIRMPVMDGLAATKMIREKDQEIPIIALTAFAMPGDKETALQFGCNEYLTKPVSKSDFIGMLGRYKIFP